MEEMRKGVVERERELKAMLAGVAHEIRNPLGGIELFTGLLNDEVTQNGEAKKHVDRISKEVAHLKEIVDSFLTYARPQEPQKESCSIKEAISEVVPLVENQLQSQHIALTLPEDLNKANVWMDPKHLKRIVLNLFQNAIQAMPDGGKINIRWKEIDDSVVHLFKDTGEGIPDEIREKIFVPFFTSREKGTGLGLSIVKELVEVNGGAIRLIKSDKNGTEFEIKLQRYTG
jgi:signal transduction histidine kinase